MGPAGGLTRDQMELLLVDRLCDHDVGLVVDEVHGCGFHGLQQVRMMHDEVRERTGRGFPLLMAGCGIYGYLRKAAEVRGRVASWTFFAPLEDELLTDFARRIHPRLSRTSPERLGRLAEIGEGYTLRGWAQVADKIDLLDSTRKRPSAPLSKKDVDTIEAMKY